MQITVSINISLDADEINLTALRPPLEGLVAKKGWLVTSSC